MPLADLLKKHREIAGMTLDEASQKLGISIGYLCDMENGRFPRPKMKRLYDLADLYGINIDEICISATRIPQDVFYKIIRCPELLQIIRDYAE